MKRVLIYLTVSVIILSFLFVGIGCKAAPTAEETTAAAEETTAAAEETTEEEEIVAQSEEVYVKIGMYTSHPIFAPDVVWWQQAGDELGVNAEFAGPTDINMEGMIEAFEQTIAQKVNGISVIGWDVALGALIDKAIAAGIPTVTFDADVPDSDRICFFGTNWYTMGQKLADGLAMEIGEKGQVGLLGMVGVPVHEQAFAGFKDTVAEKYPDIEVVTIVDDAAQIDKAVEGARGLIQAYPDIAGFAGFDAISGDGIVTAVKEAGKIGEIKIVMNDVTPEHIQYLKNGEAQMILGQKRELMTYYSLKMLYDCNHSEINWTYDDKSIGVWPIPEFVYTGFLVITPDNIDQFAEGYEDELYLKVD